jgi:hypothetical protein
MRKQDAKAQAEIQKLMPQPQVPPQGQQPNPNKPPQGNSGNANRKIHEAKP